jgi:hypothetical protein
MSSAGTVRDVCRAIQIRRRGKGGMAYRSIQSNLRRWMSLPRGLKAIATSWASVLGRIRVSRVSRVSRVDRFCMVR